MTVGANDCGVRRRVNADALNDKVIPFFEDHGIPLLRILTDRGSEYCGNREYHEYQLYLTVENIDHSKTKSKTTAEQWYL
jgi:hypothetical protein